jgi:hypothetical protein
MIATRPFPSAAVKASSYQTYAESRVAKTILFFFFAIAPFFIPAALSADVESQ